MPVIGYGIPGSALTVPFQQRRTGRMLARSRLVQPWPSWLNSYPCPIGRTAICLAASADGRRAVEQSRRAGGARRRGRPPWKMAISWQSLQQKPEPLESPIRAQGSRKWGPAAKGRITHAVRPPERPGEPIHSPPSARAADSETSHGPIRAPSLSAPSRASLQATTLARFFPQPCCKTATGRPSGRELLGATGPVGCSRALWPAENRLGTMWQLIRGLLTVALPELPGAHEDLVEDRTAPPLAPVRRHRPITQNLPSDLTAGQVREPLDILAWAASFEDCMLRPT
jgi:hypothetical protein